MAEATPTFQFLPAPRVEYYGQVGLEYHCGNFFQLNSQACHTHVSLVQEEQFWRQRAAKLQELARARHVGPPEMEDLTAVCRSVRDGG